MVKAENRNGKHTADEQTDDYTWIQNVDGSAA